MVGGWGEVGCGGGGEGGEALSRGKALRFKSLRARRLIVERSSEAAVEERESRPVDGRCCLHTGELSGPERSREK